MSLRSARFLRGRVLLRSGGLRGQVLASEHGHWEEDSRRAPNDRRVPCDRYGHLARPGERGNTRIGYQPHRLVSWQAPSATLWQAFANRSRACLDSLHRLAHRCGRAQAGRLDVYASLEKKRLVTTRERRYTVFADALHDYRAFRKFISGFLITASPTQEGTDSVMEGSNGMTRSLRTSETSRR